MEVLAVFAILILTWMFWQVVRAKQFNQFKQNIRTEIKPKLVKHIKDELVASRSKLTPNTDEHIQAALDYWTISPARILQAAIEKEVIEEDWLKKTGNVRHCQHLFHIEQQYLLAPDRTK